MKPLPATCFSQPWALIRRGGATAGKRPFTRMAYRTDTIAQAGQAVAFSGYIMNANLAGWTKHPRRIEWVDLVQTWRTAPTARQIARAKARLSKERPR